MRDAWSAGLVARGVLGTLPTVSYLVAELDGDVVGHAVTSAAGDIAELQRIAVAPGTGGAGVAGALLARPWSTQPAGTEADRMLLEVREDNAGALAFYAGRGFAEIDRRPPLLRRRCHGGGDAARAASGPAGR